MFYRCGEPGHKSNEYPKRRQVNMTDYKEEDNVLIEIESEDSDFVEEHGDPVTCVIQKVLCSQKIPDTTKRHQIFYSRCSIKDKVCNLIIDNRSYENIIFRALMDYLKLEMELHPHPHTLSWIKKNSSIKVTDLCHVPISISKYYQDIVACDMVDIDTCYILLGRPWYYDVSATHKSKENIYIFN